MSDSIDLAVRRDEESTVVVATGDLDVDTKDTFSAHVKAEAMTADRLVLDLSRIGFLDSTGIGVLVEIRQILHARGLVLHVVPSRRVRAALKLSGLLEALQVHDSLADALTVHPSNPS